MEARHALLLVLLMAPDSILGMQATLCPPGSDPCSINTEFFKTEIEKATQEYKSTLEQKVNEIALILRHMAGANLSENAQNVVIEGYKEECSAKDLYNKLSTFENELTSALKELPTRISKVDGKFELTMKKFEQDKVSTINFLDVKLGEMKSGIITEVYTKLSDVIQRIEKMSIGQEQRMQGLENRITSKLEPLVLDIERKLNKFMEKVDKTEEKKQMARDIQKRSIEEMFYSLNSSITTKINTHFALADEKLTELDEHREGTIENLDKKITALVTPLAHDVRESSQRIGKQIEQLNHESQVRGQEITNILRRAAESLKKIEIKLLSDCSKASRLTLTTLTTGQYYFSTIETDWYKAKAFCDRFGMQLASIETEEERKTLFEAAHIKNSKLQFHANRFH